MNSHPGQPARLYPAAVKTEEEIKTDELYIKVRGVLNKLTPDKLEKLVNQVRALPIDNEERLQGVIDLIFEKAVNEPIFSFAYALMCKELAFMQVPVNSKWNTKEEQRFNNFRKLLITKCQIDFEKKFGDENARCFKTVSTDCADPEKKKEPQLVLEENDKRMLVKSLGSVRFIGELFKQQMLTVKMVFRCIHILLVNKDEESLECLCELLTMVGKDLELNKHLNLNTYFWIMQNIVDKNHGKISSRVRFILQDVIDLRNSKWVPRRHRLNPTTMEQTRKDTILGSVESMLNKLTSEKIEKLLTEIRTLSIDNEEVLQGVVDLVHEKAVDEPNLSFACASFCKELAPMQVPANVKNKEKSQFVNFRRLLITRCNKEFIKNSVDEKVRNLKIRKIEECADPEKKEELKLVLEEYDTRLRVKYVGNFRFIGELFKKQMLTVRTLLRCIDILLENKDEDSLECLCTLLTTVGNDLELNKNKNLNLRPYIYMVEDLNTYFNIMQDIADKKHEKISDRVRFMLQDVIDLRNSKWVPRNQD